MLAGTFRSNSVFFFVETVCLALETTEIFFQGQSSDTVPSYWFDAELDDETIGRALSSPLFTQEREEPPSRRQADHSPEESLLPSQSLSVGHVRTGRLFNEFGSFISNVRENPSRDSENEQIRILLERQKEQILDSCRAENQKHEYQADYDRRSIQELKRVIESQKKKKFVVLIKETNDFDKINNFFKNNYWNKIGNFVKLLRKVPMRWKN